MHNKSEQSTLEHDHSGGHCPACAVQKRRMQTKLLQWIIAREAQQQIDTDVVANILELNALCQPIGAIAKATGVPEVVAKFVVQQRRLPERDIVGELAP